MQPRSLLIFLSLISAIITTLPVVSGAPLPSSLTPRDEHVDAGTSIGQDFAPYETSDLTESKTHTEYDAAVAADQGGAIAPATKAELRKGEKTWSLGSMWARIGLF